MGGRSVGWRLVLLFAAFEDAGGCARVYGRSVLYWIDITENWIGTYLRNVVKFLNEPKKKCPIFVVYL